MLVPWDGTRGVCNFCAGPLKGQQSAWCSTECWKRAYAEHDWGTVRQAAIRRDGWECQRCERVAWASILGPDGRYLVEYREPNARPPMSLEQWAIVCGLLDPDDNDRRLDWRWGHKAEDRLPEGPRAIYSAEQRTFRRYDVGRSRTRQDLKLEVNHIVPVVGRREWFGCTNHLSNVETLCHGCHVIVTKEQFAARRAAAHGEQLALMSDSG